MISRPLIPECSTRPVAAIEAAPVMHADQETRVYPADALAGRTDLDVIAESEAPTLDAQFRERVRRSAGRIAYTEFDHSTNRWRDFTWSEVGSRVARWQAALSASGLKKGDHVGVRMKNCLHWVVFDQAALGLGLIVVPLYANDRADNCNYVIDHAHIKLLLVENMLHWQELDIAPGDTPGLERVVVLERTGTALPRTVCAEDWLPESGRGLARDLTRPEELATIVYTSGTTGRPKGVMLSHRNIVSNAQSGLRSIALTPDDVLLSFLPLSHTLERTVGYFLPMSAGARLVFNRSIPELAEDFLEVKPTCVVSVPRVFERSYAEIKHRIEEGSAAQRVIFKAAVETGWARFQRRQGRGRWSPRLLAWPVLDTLVARQIRDRFGGRLRVVIVGGAPLPFSVARVFNALGVTLLQGYGLTETSPILCTNTIDQNRPETIGLPVHGVRIRLGGHDELLAKGPNVMMGYWRNDDATRESLSDGWFASGDQARIEPDGFLSITGRLKDVLVLANGEKISPADMESAIAEDPLFDQSMVIGERMPFLSALVVLDRKVWDRVSRGMVLPEGEDGALPDEEVEELLLGRIRKCLHAFPGFARIRRVTATLEPWTTANGLLTPTLKLKRATIREKFQLNIERMYEGHEIFRSE